MVSPRPGLWNVPGCGESQVQAVEDGLGEGERAAVGLDGEAMPTLLVASAS